MKKRHFHFNEIFQRPRAKIFNTQRACLISNPHTQPLPIKHDEYNENILRAAVLNTFSYVHIIAHEPAKSKYARTASENIKQFASSLNFQK